MTSRRSMLTGLGTVGITGLAGCSALPFGGGETDPREDVSLSADAFEPLTLPESPFPVGVPSSLADAHRERARELLAEVPTDPSVPNGAIAEELRSDRERAANRLARDVGEPWPTERLSRWRSRLNAVATVRGAYRAAVGEDDAATVTERRQAVYEDLVSFVGDHQYRASSPLEAVLTHAPIEEQVAECRRRSRPSPSYPADPVDRPFQAGDVVGNVEHARATLADARRLREVYRAARSDTPSQWAELIDASDRLGMAASYTRSTVRDFLKVDEPPFDADLEGTAGRALFTRASERVERGTETFEDHHDDGDYASAVIEAGRTLVAIEALRTAIEGIQNGTYQDQVTANSVSQTAERARDTIAAIEESEDERLAAQLVQPALVTVDYAPRNIERSHSHVDAARIQGELAWAELYARAVPAATAFVIGRLG